MKTEISRRELIELGAVSAFTTLGVARLFAQEPNTPPKTVMPLVGFKDHRYVLPTLPYRYDALEPFYDTKTVEIHYTKHHAASVAGLNAALEKLQAARDANNYIAIKALSRDLAFNSSGHILHTLFWQSMIPGGSKMPDELTKAMANSFGSVESAKSQFAAATKAVEASGWGILAYEPMSDKLLVLQAEKHQDLTVWGVIPLLVCDVWEHAYYLKYANDRGQWVDNFMKLANWDFAAARLAQAEKLR